MSSHSIQASRRPSGVHFQHLLDFSADHFKTLENAGNGAIVAAMLQKEGLDSRLAYLHEQGKRPNKSVYTILLKQSTKEPFDRTSDLFRSIIRSKMADVITYNAYITAAGQSGEFQEAKRAFEEAKSKKMANVITYSAYITAADNAGRFQEATIAFEEAKRKNIANVTTYSAYITAADHSGEFRGAKRAFEEAKSKKMA